MTLRLGKVIALDIGTVRVGVAISDSDRILATPLMTLIREGDKSLAREIVKLLQEHEPTLLLIGQPIDLRGEHGIAAKKMHKFIEYLRTITGRYYQVEIKLLDERMTTKIAARHLRDSGKNSRNSKNIIDQAAAVVLLQDWLDGQRKISLSED